MHPNAFIGKAEQPTEAELAAALGTSHALWDGLLAALDEEHQLKDREWSSYSRKYGWSLRVKRKKRNIVYLNPAEGGFSAALILGDKAIQAARESGLSKKGLQLVDQGTRYPEGTAVRLEIKSQRDIGILTKLAAAKLAK